MKKTFLLLGLLGVFACSTDEIMEPSCKFDEFKGMEVLGF
ncbi:hypothetical protein BC781_1221 [Sediminitomix flava]|uniref:Lipoprotein n=1 Tax=Sediminitomix flava TaxID=379075 RepID=A0A315YWA0_SEDFL|nr:hypothetical protein BC781_1221 [Sediminitomix flava]